ncbi:MAG: alpha-ketoacid dehydrogenase subunit beta [Chloroflexi bacterium]|nr:alpha-ketoacid dehydrogenase subunit beta [Chloroflexota bacterium]
MATREITYGEAVNEAIRLEMRRDPTVIIMGEDIAGAAGRPQYEDAWGGPFRASRGLIQEFGPNRVLDTPISEMGFSGAAVGAAMTGLRPIADIMFVDFAGVCLDQIMNQAAKMRYMTGGQAAMPLVIRAAIGTRALPGQQRGGGAAAQHSQTLYSLFVHIPGLKCVAPSNPYNAKGLTIAAIRDDDPVVIFDHKFLMGARGQVPEDAYVVPIGKAEVTKPGRDVTLIGISRMTQVCLEAARELEQLGLDAEVIDLLSLAPLDEEAILESVRKTKRLVVVDEDNPRCSVARDIAALVADKGFDYLDAPIKTVTAPHTPVPFSGVLEDAYVPDAARVVRAVREQLGLGGN